MNSDAAVLVASLALVFGNAFFVVAEYALVSVRRSQIEAIAKKGNRSAKLVLDALNNLSPYVAGSQIVITMLGIGVGAITEPWVSGLLSKLLRGALPGSVLSIVSVLLITFVLVVVGELVPKYVSLRHPERLALVAIRPLNLVIRVLHPLVWLVQGAGGAVARLFGVDIKAVSEGAVPKEELLMLVQTGGAEGVLERTQAEMVTRALRLDTLDARDIMIHRLDIKWLDVSLDRDGTLTKLKDIPYGRIPVCRGDIDDLIGVAYLHDIVRAIDDSHFSLETIARSPIAIPENLSLDRIVQTMREGKTQMLIVMDEYGGTSGLVTLEDVVEEVFGELEDRLESERPPIETLPGGRISARAEVRYDELVAMLRLDIDPGDNTDSLATMLVESLGRVPRPGDSVETNLGTLRVENMARRRITRVSLQLLPELQKAEG